jgi:putative sterol carrier protein
MADTKQFFSEFLPARIAKDPALAQSVNAVYQFDIANAGTWTLDLTPAGNKVTEGAAENPGCVLKTDKETWEKILDNPSLAIQMAMMGKLKVSNIGLATQLQKILSPS